MSTFWKELFRLHWTELKKSTAYHPQTEGQSEVVNKCLETYLRCFAGGQPKSWARWLTWAEFSYNTYVHTSTKMSQFQVVYGRELPHLLKFGRGRTPVDSLEEMMQERDEMMAELQLNLVKAQ